MIQQCVPMKKDIDVKLYIKEIEQKEIYRPFSGEIINYITSLSDALINNEINSKELFALGFWLRKSKIKHIRNNFLIHKTFPRVPKGICFHIAPSNVDTMFVYSWVLGLLMGNFNIVKISSKSSQITEYILSILNKLDNTDKFVSIIKYDNEAEITKTISSISNVRIIWGGDNTINEIRAIKSPAFSEDICFPDKFSFSAIDAETYIKNVDTVNLEEDFYKDMYLFNQQACSSPRLLMWVGEDASCKKASDMFYEKLAILTDKHYIDESSSILRDSFSYSSVIDADISEYKRYGRNFTVLKINNLNLNRDHWLHKRQ